MQLPVQIQAIGLKDVEAYHIESNRKMWFRKKSNWLEKDICVLDAFFPDDHIVHEGVLYLCGAAQLDGHWILGWLHPDHTFEPL